MAQHETENLSEQQMQSNRRLYHLAVERTARMVQDRNVQALAQQHGLKVLNVTWEDTARFKGSAVGPNKPTFP